MKRRPATRTPPRLSRSRSAARRDLSLDSGALYSESGLKNGSQQLLATCHDRAVELLKRNLSPGGILAATATEKSAKRGYTSIFGRDAAICAIGMALSGDALLEREAVTGLHTLAAHQAPNGQIPKFVNDDGSARVGTVSPTSGKSRVRHATAEADFWYLGCIDSTLWWLIAIAFLDERRKPRGLKRRYAKQIRLAIQWLLAQEHQRFFLLQQNEASDWADIMPRSGFVLYTNALWYHVKRLYRVPHIDRTRASFNGLFHPFSAGIAEYRRARLLNEYVLKKARYRDLFLSFVNFSFFGDEGDAFGNVLAILYGLMDDIAARRTVRALKKSRINDPYPIRVTVRPIRKKSALWRPYMARHRQNAAWQYHNGGIWPMAGGFWVAALAAYDERREAQRALVQLARVCELDNWGFTEWLHGKTLSRHGMRGQSWNAAGYLLAEHAVLGSRPLAKRAVVQ
jgi:glycogen debranching enzyme